MAKPNKSSSDAPVKREKAGKTPNEMPTVENLKAADFRKRGPSQSHKLSIGATSVLKVVKNELQLTGENLNDFISDAIVHYSKLRFPGAAWGEAVKEYNPSVLKPSEVNRINALERLIAVLGVEHLKRSDEPKFNKMMKFIEDHPEVLEMSSRQEQCKKSASQTKIYDKKNDMPLWLILIYARKFGML